MHLSVSFTLDPPLFFSSLVELTNCDWVWRGFCVAFPPLKQSELLRLQKWRFSFWAYGGRPSWPGSGTDLATPADSSSSFEELKMTTIKPALFFKHLHPLRFFSGNLLFHPLHPRTYSVLSLYNHRSDPECNFYDNPHLLLSYVRNKSKLGFAKVDHALSLYHIMISLRPLPCIVDFNLLFSAMLKIKPFPPFATVISLSRRLHSSGVRPDDYSLNILTRCYCCLGYVDLGFSVLAPIIKLGFAPDIVTFNTLINGLVQTHHPIDCAVQLLLKIVKLGFQPNLFTFNILIDGYCLLGEMDKAENLVTFMAKHGRKPNVVTLNSLINGYCKSRKIDKALALLKEEMPLKGLNPNVVTFTTLIDDLCKHQRLSCADQLFKEMKARGLKPDVIIWNSLIHGLCKNGQIDEAQQKVKEMENSRVYPDIFTYNSLMDGFCQVGQVGEAINIFLCLPKKCQRPNVVSYNIIVKGLCKAGMLNDAIELVMRMQDNGCCPPDECTYNTIIKGCLLEKDVRKACEVVRTMRSKGFAVGAHTNSLCSSLLSHRSLKDSDKALLRSFFEV